MNMEAIWTFLSTQGAEFGLKILGAIAAWIVGRWLIGMAVGLIGRGMERGKKIDPMLIQCLKSIISVGLTLILVLAILDIFGIKTTSFAALLAGAGLAIGAAWSGMLGNFAAGIFLQVLRPYTVGDFINAGGTLCTVKGLGLFATAVLTPHSRCTSTHTRPSFRLLAPLDTPWLKHRWRIARCDSLT